MASYFTGMDLRGIRAEFEGAELGDQRLNARLDQVVEVLAAAPDSSFATMCSDEALRLGLYRFIRNDGFGVDDLIAPHIGQTAQRARDTRDVLVLHDTTEMAISDHADLRSFLRAKRKGFLAHVSLVVDANLDKGPLGVVAFETLERKKVSKTRVKGRRMRGGETTKLNNRESLRWMRGVEKSADLLSEVEQVIHVMDAEGDKYELLAGMHQAGHSFVVRLAHDRCAKSAHPEAESGHIRELLDQVPAFKTTREVHLSKRSKERAPAAHRAHPPRDARTAQLSFSATTLAIKRPGYLGGLPEEISVNVVRVFEESPPPGAEPIEWILITNLEVTTKAALERIVDIYRQRWLVEEYFKALKTGCGLRKRKLLNRESLFNTLALMLPIAWRALALRHAARNEDKPASSIFSALELKVMRAKAKSVATPLPVTPTAIQALQFLAQIGGYRKSKTPPGWLTLMRGVRKLDDLVEGWALRDVITR